MRCLDGVRYNLLEKLIDDADFLKIISVRVVWSRVLWNARSVRGLRLPARHQWETCCRRHSVIGIDMSVRQRAVRFHRIMKWRCWCRAVSANEEMPKVWEVV
ncbi:hypothetical protein EVAR_95244_1 [Eumeta japonica]|uniref:Uncharacterized protein n=1 Tax=Eumeta variegata TaxID=151549 RepID=A0A4C1UJV2_EUMVA|nr:hypothetical protein EVAR_95244_1 [Eumeta japonica]